MPWPYDQQTPPWLYPAGTGAPANDEDGFDKYVRSFSQPVAPPPSFDFTDAEAADANDSPVPPIAWQPVDTAPHFDFTDAEANPPPSDLADIEIDPTNGKQPIDPYPVQVGKPRPWDPMPRETDPPSPVVDAYNAATPAQAVSPTPTPGGIIDRTLGRVADKAGTQADLAKLGASETFVDKDAPDQTPEQAQESLVDLYRRDPEARLRAEFEHARLMESERLKRETKANLDETAAMERSAQIREQARAKAKADRAQIETEARALASAPFQRYWSNAGTAQKMGGALLAVFGGLMQSSTGGRNSGIDFMMKLADDDADAKWKAIQARREMNGEAMADADEEFRQREALRLAGREQVKNTIRAELANLDPENTQALALSGGLAQMDAAEAEYAAKQMAERAKREEERLKTENEIRKTNIEAFKAEDSSKLAWAKFKRQGMGGGGGGLFGKNTRLSGEEWAVVVPGLDPSKLPKGIRLNHDEVDKILATQGKIGGQAVDVSRGKGLELENAQKAGKLRVYDPRDPSKVIGDAKDEKAAETVTEILGPSVQGTETIDRIIRIAESSDGNSDIIQNPDWQEITADKSYLDNLIRVSERMGALDSGSQTLIGKMRGGVDPNSFLRDAAPGLRRLRENIVRKAQLTMNSAGIDGNAYKFPDGSSLPKARKNELGARLAKRPSGENNLAAFGNEVNAELGADVNADEKLYDKAALDVAITAIERDGDANAAADVAEAAGSSSNPAARKAAAAKFWSLRQSGNPTAVKAFDDLDRDARAAIVRQLPKEARAAYIREVAGLTEGED